MSTRGTAHTHRNTQTKANLEKFVFQIDLAEDQTRDLSVAVACYLAIRPHRSSKGMDYSSLSLEMYVNCVVIVRSPRRE